MPDTPIWQTKVAARLHDPAEKALVLLRDPAGHENGTSLALSRLLYSSPLPQDAIPPDSASSLAFACFRSGIPASIYRHIRRADHWAAAADRPQWPVQKITIEKEGKQKEILAHPLEAQVEWTKSPVLIHPLSGQQIDLTFLGETGVEAIKNRSFDHFVSLLEKLGAGRQQELDWRKIALALWRFGPEILEPKDSSVLGELWKILPADTRVPDHSIWDHLDLVSAFAGAFAADPHHQAALLAVSIGPVQDFIAAARKTEDLWAGSHLLSRLAWETMRPLCEELGPDAILFPRLRGIPQVDVWLLEQMQLPREWFESQPWRNERPDANPLFSAALPNRFVAVVPASRAEELAQKCRDHVRQWLLDLGKRTVRRLLETAGIPNPDDTSIPAYQQVEQQLRGFPEVHWAITPFSLAVPRDTEKDRDLDVDPLRRAMAPFFGVSPDKDSGFLASTAWKVLQQHIEWPDGVDLIDLTPVVLYQAFYELNERLLASAKSVRAFHQQDEQGWRCTLTGETEWLTHNREHLMIARGHRQNTLWTRIAEKRPSWARKGEHLGALPAIKRLWPTLFAEEVAAHTSNIKDRFVVSTHAMAVAHQLRQWLLNGAPLTPEQKKEVNGVKSRVALPAQLAAREEFQSNIDAAARIPAIIEEAREQSEKAESGEDSEALARARQFVREILCGRGPDAPQLENYYALILMDGDHMGAILSGDESAGTSIPFEQSFHPSVRRLFQNAPGLIRQYAAQRRPVSPNRHLAISGALNDFSQIVVKHVLEHEFAGRVIYSGGDDVLAMLPVADALAAIARLRQAYSGEGNDELPSPRPQNTLFLSKGFAYLNGRLMRMMGLNATASCGLVVAHHQTPLSLVLRELRSAEREAKNFRRTVNGKSIDRNAWHVRILKRSGGRIGLSGEWGAPLDLLIRARDFLASPEVSRRAVYNSLLWLHDLPQTGGRPDPDQLKSLLAYQLERQTDRPKKAEARQLAQELAQEALRHGEKPLERLESFLTVAEFLAREQRATKPAPQEVRA